ncbi:MAG: hypothetical protein A8274_143 [Halanaerobium sp. 4-GBenrich]|uniref:Putative peroxidase-related enzyme n=1 Tax=Halanaerobium congolense TaxID=54121 RepID=A0A1G6NVP8_9FIRM|nr:MAG: hypothetical protein A8274_143 [Halanaerobium sp. 4-GBenrich]PUU87821.1 MAG: hypothetical protein CI948_2490 [Halanaerobium sp.]TDS24803.1 putative peroxidase-related enzyme [Halanaerobium congolense]TDX43721.1 putative peroxidase-related enzyme [Halanaerobium congolense]SDC72002.1 uncharacterized peroxidase-related enzyme [Halanaerobium congolense]
MIRDDEQADKILSGVLDDYNSAPISEKEKEMLDYAVKLTKKPASVKKEDLDRLREFDLSDRDILDLNQVVAYFNYVNRTADGLGIELEAEHK